MLLFSLSSWLSWQPDPNRRLTCVRNHGLELFLPLSVEHSGFWLEADPFKALELLQLHSGGKVSQALAMALNVADGFRPTANPMSKHRSKRDKVPITTISSPKRNTQQTEKQMEPEPKDDAPKSPSQSFKSPVSSPPSSPNRKNKLRTGDLHFDSPSSPGVPDDELMSHEKSIMKSRMTSPKEWNTIPVETQSDLSPPSSTPPKEPQTFTEQRSPAASVSPESSSRVAEVSEATHSKSRNKMKKLPDLSINTSPNKEAPADADSSVLVCSPMDLASLDIFGLMDSASSHHANTVTQTFSAEESMAEPIRMNSPSRVVAEEAQELIPLEARRSKKPALDEESDASARESEGSGDAVEPVTSEDSYPSTEIDSTESHLNSNTVSMVSSFPTVEEVEPIPSGLNSVVYSNLSFATYPEGSEVDFDASGLGCPTIDLSPLDILAMLSFAPPIPPQKMIEPSKSLPNEISKGSSSLRVSETQDSGPMQVTLIPDVSPSQEESIVEPIMSPPTTESTPAESLSKERDLPESMSMDSTEDEETETATFASEHDETNTTNFAANVVQAKAAFESLSRDILGMTSIFSSQPENPPMAPPETQPPEQMSSLDPLVVPTESTSYESMVPPGAEPPVPTTTDTPAEPPVPTTPDTPESIPSPPPVQEQQSQSPRDALDTEPVPTADTIASNVMPSPILDLDQAGATQKTEAEKDDGIAQDDQVENERSDGFFDDQIENENDRPHDEIEADGPDDETDNNRSSTLLAMMPQILDVSEGDGDSVEHDEAIDDMIANDFLFDEDTHIPDIQAVIRQARLDLATDTTSTENSLEAATLKAKSTVAAMQAESSLNNETGEEGLTDGSSPPSTYVRESAEEEEEETKALRAEIDRARQLADKYSKQEVEVVHAAPEPLMDTRETSMNTNGTFDATVVGPDSSVPRENTVDLLSPPHAADDIVEAFPTFQATFSDKGQSQTSSGSSDNSTEEDELTHDILNQFTAQNDSDDASTDPLNGTTCVSFVSSATDAIPLRGSDSSSTVPTSHVQNTNEIRLVFRVKKTKPAPTPIPADESGVQDHLDREIVDINNETDQAKDSTPVEVKAASDSPALPVTLVEATPISLASDDINETTPIMGNESSQEGLSDTVEEQMVVVKENADTDMASSLIQGVVDDQLTTATTSDSELPAEATSFPASEADEVHDEEQQSSEEIVPEKENDSSTKMDLEVDGAEPNDFATVYPSVTELDSPPKPDSNYVDHEMDNSFEAEASAPHTTKEEFLPRTDSLKEEDEIVAAILNVGVGSRLTAIQRSQSQELFSSKSIASLDVTAENEYSAQRSLSSNEGRPPVLTRSDTEEEEDEIVHDILDEFTAVASQQEKSASPTVVTQVTHPEKKGLMESYSSIAQSRREKEEAEKLRANEALLQQQQEREASRLLSIQKLEAGMQRLETDRKETWRLEAEKAAAARAVSPRKTPETMVVNPSGNFVAPTRQEGNSFVLLISKTSGAPTQKSNQEKTMLILQCKRLPFEVVDGSDPDERDLRNSLFGISGIRGNYPQLFLQQSDGKISFVGNFETIDHLNDSGALGDLLSPKEREDSVAPLDGVSIVNGKCLVVLLSTTCFNQAHKANQDRALAMLNANRIQPEILDGADQSIKDLRNHLFSVSGIRGLYPQFFLKRVATGEYSFVGTYGTIENLNDEGPLEEVFGEH